MTAVVLLFATWAVAISGDWSTTCTDPTGHELGGIDCFQYNNGVPHSDSGVAGWLGFVPLVVIGGVAFVTLAAISASWFWRQWKDAKT